MWMSIISSRPYTNKRKHVCIKCTMLVVQCNFWLVKHKIKFKWDLVSVLLILTGAIFSKKFVDMLTNKRRSSYAPNAVGQHNVAHPSPYCISPDNGCHSNDQQPSNHVGHHSKHHIQRDESSKGMKHGKRNYQACYSC